MFKFAFIFLAFFTFSSFAERVSVYFEEAGLVQAVFNPVQQDQHGRSTRTQTDFETKFQNDLADISRTLLTPEDPWIRIRIGNDYSSYKIEIKSDPDGVDLRIEPGVFAATKNLNEVAGVLSIQFAKIREDYKASLLKRFENIHIPKDQNRTEFLKKEWQKKIRENAEIKDLRLARELYHASEDLDKIQMREENTKLKQVIQDSGIKIQLNAESEAKIKQGIDAVDRLVKGGYNPWGIYQPRKKLGELERLGWKQKGAIAKFFNKKENSSEVNSSTATELAFLETYLLYLESKKVDITQQKYRNQGLTPEQQKLSGRAKFSQFIKFGPVMQDVTIGGGVTALTGLALYYGSPIFYGTLSGLGKAKDWVSDFFSSLWGSTPATEAAKVVEKTFESAHERGPGFWDSIWGGAKNLFGSAYNNSVYYLKEFIGKPIGNTYDYINDKVSFILDPIKNSSYEAYLKTLEFLEPLTKHVQELGIEGSKLATVTFAAYLTDRILLSKPRLWANKYLSRYKNHMTGQVNMLVDLIPKYFLGSDAKSIQESVKLQQSMTRFVEDGMDPSRERIFNRMIYQVLFDKSAFWYLYHSQVRQGEMKKYRAEVERKVTELFIETYKEKYGNSPTKISKRQIAKLVRELTYPDLFENPTSDAPSDVINGMKDPGGYSRRAAAFQKFLYFITGSLSYRLSDFNTKMILGIIENKLADPKLSERDKKEYLKALEEIAGLDLYTESTRKKYLSIFERHYPDHKISHLQDPAKLNEYWLKKDLDIETKLFMTKAKQLARRGNLSIEEKIIHFNTLVDKKMNGEAMRFLTKNLESISNHIHAKNSEDTVRANTLNRVRDLLGNTNLVNITSLLTKKLLFLKVLSIKDKNIRLAFFTHNLDSFITVAGPLEQGFLSLSETVITKYLGQVNSAQELIQVLENLGAEYHVESRFLAEYFLMKLQQNPNLIKNLDDIKIVTNSNRPWHILSSVARQQSSKLWEHNIFQRYEELSKKYKSYNYNPGHSEKIQKILVDKYEALYPNATIEQKFEFWNSIANRGPGGVTDIYFEKMLSHLDTATSEKACQYALANGLIWDPQIRTRLFKELYKEKMSPKNMQEFVHKELEELSGKIKAKQAEPNSHYKFLNSLIELKNIEDKNIRKGIYTELLKVLREPNGDPLKVLNKYPLQFESIARLKYIDQNVSQLHDFFPETGYAFAELLDWMSYKLQTRQNEAFYIKEKLLKNHSESKDFAYSAVNNIIEDATSWHKVDQWELIRWLRGTGAVPQTLEVEMKKMGPETMRRLYSTLPIFARRAFISTLLNAPKSGLLNGLEKNLYYEQILNEVLPKKRQSSEISQELLSAFLNAVGQVSDPAKKNSVLSFLLSHPAENSDTGTVLKNILEAYGVPGVKLGQLLASSDLLPEDIRERLSELRDQAKEPLRHEIYERLQEILKEKNIEAKFIVKDLLGAASVKYAITVVDTKGKTHVIQIKREEAEAAISRNFEELKIIVEDLVKKNPKRYAFLKGMVEATKDAIWRELSLAREAQKAQFAQQEYKKLDVENHVKINVVQSSELIKQIGGPKERFFYLRSSELADGKVMRHFPVEVQKALAKVVLTHEQKLIFPADQRDTKIDPDRHPGNILFKFDSKTGEIEYLPIDWGQQYELSEKERSQVKKFMAYSQLFEHLGALPSLTDKFVADIQAQEGALETKQLKRLLESFYPNKTGKPRSSLGPYYFLLSALEEAGMRRNMAFYDLIKGIYQLEYYEGLLKGEKHDSPKREFISQVEKEVQRIVADIQPTLKEKIRYALTDPKAALIANKNSHLAYQGVLALDGLLSGMGVSANSRKQLLKGLNKETADKLLNAQQIIEWLQNQTSTQGKNITNADNQILKKWLSHEKLKAYNLENMTKEELGSLMNNTTVLQDVHGKKFESMRSLLRQPYKHEFLKSMGNVYAAELVNSIFWGIYDRDPIRAQEWFFGMASLSKHTGFLAFAMSHSGVNALSNKLFPLSYKGSRYLMGNGVGVAAGMLASDIVHRLWSGESFSEIWDSLATTSYGKELTFQTGGFMVSEALVGLGLSLLANKLPKSITCNYFYRKILPLTGAFIGAEVINRTVGEQLRDYGILDKNELHMIKKIVDKHHPIIEERIRAFEKELKRNDYVKAREVLTGDPVIHSLGDVKKHKNGYEFKEYGYGRDNNNPDSAFYAMDIYLMELNKIIPTLKDKRAIGLIIKEKSAILNLKQQLFENAFKGRVWSEEELKKIDPQNRVREKGLWEKI